MSETQELRTNIVFDTTGVDRGLQQVEKAVDRLGATDQKAASTQSARSARSTKQQAQEQAKALRAEEKQAKESADRIVAIREACNQRLDKLDKARQSQIAQGARTSGVNATLSAYEGVFGKAGGTAASRAGSSGAGGHGGSKGSGGSGGHGGGFAGTRMLGDALNAVTGGSGNVMRLNMLTHMGPLLGGAGVIAAIAAKGFENHAQMVENTQGMQRAMGERTQNSLFSNGFTGGFMRMLPSGLRPEEFTHARAQTQSAEGIDSQRAAIKEEVKKAQEGRGGLGGYARTFARTLVGADPIMRALGVHTLMDKRENESFKTEERAQDKLIQLDQRKAAIIKDQTAARHVGNTQGEHAGRLAQIDLEHKEKLAALNDRANLADDDPKKMGVAEYSESKKDLDSKHADDRRREQHDGAATRRGINEQNQLTDIRSRGEDTALNSARARLGSANAAVGAALDPEERAKAVATQRAATQDVVESARETEARKGTLAVEKDIANFRGGAEARAVFASKAQLADAERLLVLAKSAGAEQTSAAQLVVDQRKLALDLTLQEQAATRQSNASALQHGVIRENSARFALGQNTGSADESTRFAAGQAVASEHAASGVAEARETLRLANDLVITQKGSAAAIQEQKLAQQGLNQAMIAQLSTAKQLQLDTLHRNIQQQTQRDAAQNETAAMRMGNTGRVDKASVMRSRAASQARALEHERNGRPDLAKAEQEQQHEREVGMFDDKYMDKDGRMKSRSVLNREERAARKISGKRTRLNERLEKNSGLINVQRDSRGHVTGGMDPLTMDHVSAAQLYARKESPHKQAMSEKAQEGSIQQSILTVLEERLPAAAQ